MLLDINIMAKLKTLFIFSLLTCLISTRLGMTWKLSVLPTQSNNFAGEVDCSGCDPYNGDTPCETELPVLCLKNEKSIPRPYYDYGPIYSPSGYAIGDFEYYMAGQGELMQQPLPSKERT